MQIASSGQQQGAPSPADQRAPWRWQQPCERGPPDEAVTNGRVCKTSVGQHAVPIVIDATALTSYSSSFLEPLWRSISPRVALTVPSRALSCERHFSSDAEAFSRAAWAACSTPAFWSARARASLYAAYSRGHEGKGCDGTTDRLPRQLRTCSGASLPCASAFCFSSSACSCWRSVRATCRGDVVRHHGYVRSITAQPVPHPPRLLRGCTRRGGP